MLRSNRSIAFVALLVAVLGVSPVSALQVTQLTLGSSDPSYYEVYQSEPAWSPNGSFIAYAKASWIVNGEPYMGIGIVTPQGADGPTFTPPAWMQYHPTWSRDGATIAFVGSGILWKAPVSSYWEDEPVAFVNTGTPNWSPVEDRIVFETGGHLAIVASTGGALTHLPGSGGHNPGWSPDGTTIAYDAAGRIWVLDLASLVATPITSATTDEHPTWSPDGGWIAFSSRRSGSRALWVVASTGGAPIQLTTGATNDYEPVWSPDGETIAFTSERSGDGPHLWLATDLPDFTVAVQPTTWSQMKSLYSR